MKRRRKRARKIFKWEGIFLVVAGLLLGTIFTVNSCLRLGLAAREQAVPVEAQFSHSSEIRSRHSGLKEIILHFSDHEKLWIRAAGLPREDVRRIEALPPGATLRMLIEPHGSYILELTAGEEVLLDFDAAVGRMHAESINYLLLALLMYAAATVGIVKLARKQVY